MKIKNEWWTCTFYPFYNLRTSKDLEILRQSSYMSHILKGLSKRNTHIPHIVLYDEEKWQKMCSNAYFGFFSGWRTFLESDPMSRSLVTATATVLGVLAFRASRKKRDQTGC